MSTLVFVTSALFGIAAYGYYFRDTKDSNIVPNRWSWLAFGLSSVIEVLTFNEVSGDPVKSSLFFISAGCCLVVTTLIWSKAKWLRPDWTELCCFAACMVATILWLQFGMAGWGHFIMIVAIPISFIPTYRSAWREWKSEDTPAWMLWSVGDGLAVVFVVLRLEKAEELPYAAVEFLSHLMVWCIVRRGRKASS